MKRTPLRTSRKVPSIVEFCTDPQLLGLTLSPAQETLLRAVHGLPLSPEQQDLYVQCTGRQTYTLGRPVPEVTVIAGARSGKDSRILVPLLLWEAIFGGHEAHLHVGERGVIPLVAQDQRATRVAFGYVRDYLLNSSVLKSLVAEQLSQEITLTNGLSLSCFPCTLASLRGWSVPAAGLDEVAFYRIEGQADSDAEIQTSIKRGMVGFPVPRLVKVSTPYVKSGVLHDDFTRGWGHEDQDLLVWRAATTLMNPSISEARLARERRRDPERARREYDAFFVEAIDAFLPGAWVDAAVINGRFELPPRPGSFYVAAVDPSGGGQAAFTLGIVHLEGNPGDPVHVVLDVLKSWQSRRTGTVDLESVVRECASLIKAYGGTTVVGDAYAKQWVIQAFARQGITYLAARAKAECYLEIEPRFAQGLVELLDHPHLIRELKLLERQSRPGGKVRVDHPRGANDDHANVLAVAADAALGALPDAAGVDLEPSLEEKRALAALGFRFPDDNVVYDDDLGLWMDDPNYPKW